MLSLDRLMAKASSISRAYLKRMSAMLSGAKLTTIQKESPVVRPSIGIV